MQRPTIFMAFVTTLLSGVFLMVFGVFLMVRALQHRQLTQPSTTAEIVNNDKVFPYEHTNHVHIWLPYEVPIYLGPTTIQNVNPTWHQWSHCKICNKCKVTQITLEQ